MLGWSGEPAVQFILFLLFLVVTLSIGVFSTQKISLASSGSGIPEVKTILSGNPPPPLVLEIRTLIAKVIGLIFAVGSGASLGKVGPFVHIGALIINNVAKLGVFKKIKANKQLMQQMLGVGCAIGYGASLGTPIGGVLLSIEVTSTYYALRNYWYSFVGALASSVVYRYLHNSAWGQPGFRPLIQTHFPVGGNINFGLMELFIFVLLGAVLGVLAAIFIKMNERALLWWRNFQKKHQKKRKWMKSPYAFAFGIALLTAVMTFPHVFGNYNTLPAFVALSDLFSEHSLNDASSLNAKDWNDFTIYGGLFMFVATRFILTAVSSLLALPGGIYAPILSIGGGLGRIFGEFAALVFAKLSDNFLFEAGTIIPGGYAIVGAASFAAAVTHTHSSAVVIFELTGQLQYVLPTLIATSTAIAVAKKLHRLGIYDNLIKLKGLPYLPDITKEGAFDIKAKDVMQAGVKYVVKGFAYEDVVKLLQETDYPSFPVVDSPDTMILLGIVERTTFEKVQAEYFQKRRDVQKDLVQATDAFKFDIPDSPDGNLMQTVPIQLSEDTPLMQIHQVFITMRLPSAYVTRNGRLLGRVSRGDLKRIIEAM
eukprot:TRINITY_DN4996_c0_g1_i4.p1 TRINITY_DN4996_c0_g1~~TRINITY_DN4996_c0_g1_i4.p1  ORF type:complete len:595 (-),score=108.49 TRINITY_DN4996_c0_g1_i4:40-1824(-)